MKVPSLLKNKYVFYGLAVLAVLNVVGYVSVRAYECLALFVLTAYSAHCYCKNESLAVLAALFVANFVFGCGRVKEGMEDMMKGPKEHMEDAAESAAVAEGMCNAAAMSGASDAADAEQKCTTARVSAEEGAAACAYTAAQGTWSATNMGTCADPPANSQ